MIKLKHELEDLKDILQHHYAGFEQQSCLAAVSLIDHAIQEARPATTIQSLLRAFECINDLHLFIEPLAPASLAFDLRCQDGRVGICNIEQYHSEALQGVRYVDGIDGVPIKPIVSEIAANSLSVELWLNRRIAFAQTVDLSFESGESQRFNVAELSGVRSFLPSGQKLDPDTLLLKFPSFDHADQVEALLHEFASELQTCRTLIIDLRGNGGGVDSAWQGLLDYVFDRQTIKVDFGHDEWVTQRNVEYRIQLLDKHLNKHPDPFVADFVNQLRSTLPVNVPFWREAQVFDEYIEGKPYPEKVRILIDRYCGSSAEIFLLAARQSSKAVLVGEPTTGSHVYGNVASLEYPGLGVRLWYPTSRCRLLRVDSMANYARILPHSSF